MSDLPKLWKNWHSLRGHEATFHAPWNSFNCLELHFSHDIWKKKLWWYGWGRCKNLVGSFGGYFGLVRRMFGPSRAWPWTAKVFGSKWVQKILLLNIIVLWSQNIRHQMMLIFSISDQKKNILPNFIPCFRYNFICACRKIKIYCIKFLFKAWEVYCMKWF